MSNLAPGATARMGIAPADLRRRHPDVIPVEIDGYGPGRPLSHKRAYDLLVQAESGACAVTGYPGMPAKPGPPVADISHRPVRGAVDHGAAARPGTRPIRAAAAPAVAVSLFDTMTDIMGYQLTYTQHSGIDQQPLGMSSPAVAPYGAFATRDGQTVVLGTTNDREWQRVAREIIERPDLADDPRFATNADRVRSPRRADEAIGTWCAQHDLADIQKTADAAGIGNSRYNLPSEVVAHPQLTGARPLARGRHPGGPDPGAAAAAGDHRLRTADGCGARARPAHRRRAGRTRPERRRVAALRDQGAIGPSY